MLQLQSEKASFYTKRNASIALVHLLTGVHADRGVVEKVKMLNLGTESSFSACLRHYQMFGHHICCFDDIRKYVIKLSVSERSAYLQEVEDICRKASITFTSEVSELTL